jgi:DNA-binding transcriptional ArsR family regulator
MDTERIERISKALADQTRLRIYKEISAGGEVTCGELVQLRGITPATVSHHLHVLFEAGLIECRKEGQFVYSRAVGKTIEQYAAALVDLAGNRAGATGRRPRPTSGAGRTSRRRG